MVFWRIPCTVTVLRALPPFLFAVLVGGFSGCSGDSFAPSASSGGAAGSNGGVGGGGSSAGGPGGTGGKSAGAGGNAGAADPGGAAGMGGSSGSSGTSGSAGIAGAPGGSSGAAGQAGGDSGAAGKAGGGGSAGGGSAGASGGSAGSGGKAGKGGGPGKAGAGGGGAAGGPATCEESRPLPNVSAFVPSCQAPFTSCVLPHKAGTRAQVAATTCGVAVAHTLAPMTIGVSFPERPDVLTVSLPGADAPHGIAMLGPRLLVGSSGDALIGVSGVGVGVTPVPFMFAPPGTASLDDALGYRSIVATNQVVAWTGRQGFEVTLLAPAGFACTQMASQGGCTEQRSFLATNAQANTPSPGWGVTAIGKTVYWSTAVGVHSIGLGDTAGPAKTLGFPGTQPGALTTTRGHVVLGRGELVTLIGPDLAAPGAIVASVPISRGEIRDLIAYDDSLFIVTKGNGMGGLTTEPVTIGGGKVTAFIIEMPSTTEPLSVAAGPFAAYVGTTDGTVYRFPTQ